MGYLCILLRWDICNPQIWSCWATKRIYLCRCLPCIHFFLSDNGLYWDSFMQPKSERQSHPWSNLGDRFVTSNNDGVVACPGKIFLLARFQMGIYRLLRRLAPTGLDWPSEQSVHLGRRKLWLFLSSCLKRTSTQPQGFWKPTIFRSDLKDPWMIGIPIWSIFSNLIFVQIFSGRPSAGPVNWKGRSTTSRCGVS